MRTVTVEAYPTAGRQALVEDLHGQQVPDPYRWLEDPTDPATRRWQAEQDTLWQASVAAWAGRDRWHHRIAELSSPDGSTPPTWRGQAQFYELHSAGRPLPQLCTAGPDGVERVLLDPLAIDARGTTTLDAWHVDETGALLAYQLSSGGSERSTLSVLDVATGRVVDGPIGGCRYSPVGWLPGGRAFFYVRVASGDETRRRRIYLHRVGTPAATDDLLTGPDLPDADSWGLGISPDGRRLIVSATSGAKPGNDLWLADLTAAGPGRPPLQLVQSGAGAVAVVGRDDRLYVVTDRDAPRGRICVGDPDHPDHPHIDSCRELVAEQPDAVLTDIAVLDGPDLERPLLLVGRTRHAIGAIDVHDLATGEQVGSVPLPGAGSIGSLSTRPDGGHEAWFTYTDAVTPPRVHRFDARTGTTTPWPCAARAAATSEIVSTQLTCHSADGTPVRVVVLARRDVTGPRPAILYGYGGFGIPLTPSYSSYALAWVEAGGVFATAQLRGGGEEGEEWHRAGTLERKQNVFDDFIAVAEHLVATGWTAPDRLGICGESNGGLLVGAAITQRPDLFAAAVCSAPLLDMLRYERSELGPSWRSEYGSAADPTAFGWLRAYSPYHRVDTGVDYPAVLFTTFDGDTRVDPWHARKMCAALQFATSSGPVLLRHERDVGHGNRATDRAVALAADMLAFLGAHTGLDP